MLKSNYNIKYIDYITEIAMEGIQKYQTGTAVNHVLYKSIVLTSHQ